MAGVDGDDSGYVGAADCLWDELTEMAGAIDVCDFQARDRGFGAGDELSADQGAE